MPEALQIDFDALRGQEKATRAEFLRVLREREKAAKAEVLRRFGARGTQPIPGSHGLSRKQRRLAKLMAEAERRKERDDLRPATRKPRRCRSPHAGVRNGAPGTGSAGSAMQAVDTEYARR
jgi:hypothetical protein